MKKAVPGFVATKRFDEGIKETVEFILKNKDSQKDDPEFDSFCDKVIAIREKAISEFK